MQILDIFLHLDQYLGSFSAEYGAWIYLLLFLVVFCETGLVVMPFLPGDSLLFVAGAVAATGGIDVNLLVLLLCVAAILGNTVNYAVGRTLGKKLAAKPGAWFIKQEHLDRTHGFFEKHGGKAVILTRFMPILRTFAPFVAGIGAMPFARFQLFNIVGALIWVISLVYGGYFLGNFPIVKENLSILVVLIIVVSLLPAIIEFFRQRNLARG